MAQLEPLIRLANGYQASQVFYTVLKFNFAEHLKDGPKSGEEVAVLAHTHVENTVRVLRAAATFGLFDRDPTTLRFSLNEQSKLFLSDEPSSIKWFLLHLAAPYTVEPWCNLDKAVETGAYPHQIVHGMNCFEFYGKNPEAGSEFNKAMTAISVHLPVASALLANYNFKDVKHVIDIGGGQGALLTAILRGNPHLKGTNFDLPSVIEEAKTNKPVDFSDVESRFSYAGGSFFEGVPAGGDLYTMKFIIHDWDDAKSIEILKNIHKVLPANGKVMLLERVIKETGDPQGSLMDLHMLVLNEAKERTEAQFQHLFKSAGLKITQFLPLPPSFAFAIIGEKA